MGRALGNNLVNLGMLDECRRRRCTSSATSSTTSREAEPDAGLGNGGLGRLAACFLDSMATLGLPGYGYGIRYEFGIFDQDIVDGAPGRAPGRVAALRQPLGDRAPRAHRPGRASAAASSTSPTTRRPRSVTSGSTRRTCSAALRHARSPATATTPSTRCACGGASAGDEFDLDALQRRRLRARRRGQERSPRTSPRSSTRTTTSTPGKELRLKQEYFFVVCDAAGHRAPLQEARPRRASTTLPDKVAIQLNDTHPAIAIAELMRAAGRRERARLGRGLGRSPSRRSATPTTRSCPRRSSAGRWRCSSGCCRATCRSSTRSTAASCAQVRDALSRRRRRALRRMSIIEEGAEKQVRMAHLAIVGSHTVNGVAALHTRAPASATSSPTSTSCAPSGSTTRPTASRRGAGCSQCNPRLSRAHHRGASATGWVTDLDAAARARAARRRRRRSARRWRAGQAREQGAPGRARSQRRRPAIAVDPDSIFDVQVKRIHEYKRQLLNVLHVIALYNRIKRRPDARRRAAHRASSAARRRRATRMAKLIIQLINAVADVVNGDPTSADRLAGRLPAELPRVAGRADHSRPPTCPSRSRPPARRRRAPAT